LETDARVHVGRKPPGETPSVVVLGVGGTEGIVEGVERIRKETPGTFIVAFGLHLDLELARTALRAGARGFVHAGMTPDQIVRALSVAAKGQIVAPRQMLEYLIVNEQAADLDILSDRQREILQFVGDGMTNAQIAKRLFLTESTVKQHLRAAYKILGVSNRTEAARLLRSGS
jgi:DNA-binding NarL/FixJ family response regulator